MRIADKGQRRRLTLCLTVFGSHSKRRNLNQMTNKSVHLVARYLERLLPEG